MHVSFLFLRVRKFPWKPRQVQTKTAQKRTFGWLGRCQRWWCLPFETRICDVFLPEKLWQLVFVCSNSNIRLWFLNETGLLCSRERLVVLSFQSTCLRLFAVSIWVESVNYSRCYSIFNCVEHRAFRGCSGSDHDILPTAYSYVRAHAPTVKWYDSHV